MTEVRKLAAARPLLCREQGLGLRLVRLAALDVLSTDERRRATMRVRLDGPRLHVTATVADGAGEGEGAGTGAAAPAAMARRALDAAALAAVPLSVRVPLPPALSASQLIGRRGQGVLPQLQHALEQAIHDKTDPDQEPRESWWCT